MAALARRAWPGNVRELENVIERAAILSATREINECDLGSTNDAATLQPRAALDGNATDPTATPDSATLRTVERQQIARALREAQGNRSQAARALGIERKTLYKKARRLGVDLDAPEE